MPIFEILVLKCTRFVISWSHPRASTYYLKKSCQRHDMAGCPLKGNSDFPFVSSIEKANSVTKLDIDDIN